MIKERKEMPTYTYEESQALKQKERLEAYFGSLSIHDEDDQRLISKLYGTVFCQETKKGT